MKTRSKWSIGVAFGLALLTACGNKTAHEAEAHEILPENAIELNGDQYANAGIRMGSVDYRPLSTLLRVNGTVNVTPQNLATVSAPLGGFIKSTTLVQGSIVKKGEILATIENISYIEIQQAYLETKARYTYAESEFRRHSDLYKDQVYSEKNLQQTETEYKTLKAQLKGLEQKIVMLGMDPAQLTEDKISSILPVRAPIDGYIRSININIGRYTAPTDILFEIVNPANVILELVLFEKDIQKVSAGQKVTFTSPNEAGSSWTATIYQAGRALDKDKTSMVYASIDKPDPHLLSGMYVNGEIQTSSREVSVVPQESVVQFNSKFYLFAFKGKRMENGKQIYDFQAIEVKRGATEAGFTEILLPSGTDYQSLQVVVKGAYALLSAWKNAGEMAC
jgi:cobalt-zinc-cadmium efflux system membrane fusion protein